MHPDRAVLTASLAEDVVLDLQSSGDEEESEEQQEQSTSATGMKMMMANYSPKAAPRSTQNIAPIAKPRSGTAGVVNKYLLKERLKGQKLG